MGRHRYRPQKRSGRETWEVRFDDGGRRSRTFATEADAADFAAELRRRDRLGAHAPAEASTISLSAWLETWWDRYGIGWAPNTQRQRSSLMDKWIEPYIGHVPLRNLGVDRICQYRAEIVADGLPVRPGQQGHRRAVGRSGRAQRGHPGSAAAGAEPLQRHR